MLGISFAGTTYAASVHKTDTVKKEVLRDKKEEATKQVNLNTATAEELQTLKGIGPKKAQDIIDYRNKNGAFKTIEDLKSIKGFTDKCIAKLLSDNPGLIIVS
jgi:competence protein ComEA